VNYAFRDIQDIALLHVDSVAIFHASEPLGAVACAPKLPATSHVGELCEVGIGEFQLWVTTLDLSNIVGVIVVRDGNAKPPGL
jgi:hypothetical protein